MKSRMPPSTLGMLAVVVALIIAIFWLTDLHNQQLKTQTELHNAQLKIQAETFNTQMKAQTEAHNAQLAAQEAAFQQRHN